MSSPIAVRSMFDQTKTVLVDQWAVNPLVDDATQAVPDTANLALVANGQPPTMFDSGDLPPFTASGMDPRFLATMPWRIRHAAAMNPDLAEVLGWVELYGHDSTVDIPSQGQSDYIGRMRDWLGGKWTNPDFRGSDPAQQADAENDLFGALFGDIESAHQARLDTLAKTNPPQPRTAEERAAFNLGRATR